MQRSLVLLFSILLTSAAVAAPVAATGDAGLCVQAIARTEHGSQLPEKLLGAIGVVESGRYEPTQRTVLPWPWTINAAGASYLYATKSEAVAAVQGFQAAGVQSIDVGCMQVSLQYHPDAFASLDEAFDPGANVAFAARFLSQLFRDTGSWPKAAAAYHSRTPDIAGAYWQRVAAIWPLAGAYGDAPAAPQARLLKQIDPYGVDTPEFAARLRADARFRLARDAAMRGPGCRIGEGAACASLARTGSSLSERRGVRNRHVAALRDGGPAAAGQPARLLQQMGT